MVVEGFYINQKNGNIGLGVPYKRGVAYFNQIGFSPLWNTLQKGDYSYLISELTGSDRLVLIRELAVWNDQ